MEHRLITLQKILLLTSLLTALPAAADQVERIRQAAGFFGERMTSQSGIPDFGCDRKSIEYIDGFLTRQRAIVNRDEATIDRFTSMIGSYIGECILKTYEGKWNVSENGVQLTIYAGGQYHILKPFHEVYERIITETDGLLVGYLFIALPSIIGSNSSGKDSKQ